MLAVVSSMPIAAFAQTVVFQENYENAIDNTADGAQSYSVAGDSYTGTNPPGQSYTGSVSWINGFRCSGIVLSASNSTQPTWATTAGTNFRCVASNQSYGGVRTIARGMGVAFGGNDTNHVVSAYTECTPAGTCDTLPSGPTNGVMFQTNSLIPVTANRYYTFAVDTGAMNCANPTSSAPQAGDPQYQFQLWDGITGVDVGATLNACRSATANTVNNLQTAPFPSTKVVYTKRMLANTAIKFTGNSLGVRMYSVSGVTNGNDGAFDNIRVLEVTPSLSKAFSPATVAAGGTVQIVFTITNTSDNLAKPGWEFTDNLAANLSLANTTVGGTCRNFADTGTPANLVGSAGATSFTIRGSLPAVASCTVTVNVQVAAGTNTTPLQNCGSNISNPQYINPPPNSGAGACATLNVTRPVTLTKVWQGGTSPNAVSLNISGAGVSAATAGSSTAPSTTTNATAQAVLGSTVTLTEAFTNGSAANYATGLACVRATDNSEVLVSGSGLSRTIVMPDDSAVNCTFTNVRSSSITIIKDAAPDDAQDFSFTSSIPGAGNAGFSLDDDGDSTLANTRAMPNLAPGSYTVTETAAAGWTLTGLSCTGDIDNGSNLNTGTRTAIIDLDAGENVICTFINTHNPQVNLWIRKSNNAPGSLDDLANDTLTSGATTTYTLTVINDGPDPVTGGVVRDTPGAGLTCAASNPVTITGNGVPSGSFTVADLTGAGGIVLGQLTVGQSATLRYDCTVN